MAGQLVGQTMQGILASMAVPVTIGVIAVSVNAKIQKIVASRSVAAACAARFAGAPGHYSKGACGSSMKMPLVVMDDLRMPGIGEHVSKSQMLGSPAILNRQNYWIVSNRALAIGKCAAGLDIPVSSVGRSCDEYPFASTVQGGFYSTVAKVPLLSNLVQGGVLSSFYSICGVIPNIMPLNEFLVIPAQSTSVGFECNWF